MTRLPLISSLLGLALGFAGPALASGPAGDTGRVGPNGQICRMVPIGIDEWALVGVTHRRVCQTLAPAPGQPAVSAPPRLAQLPRR